MSANTIIGALLAAIVTGLTATLALLTGEGVTQLSDISTLQWVIMLVGVALAFFKDFQALTVRRLANKMTGTGDGGI